MLCSLNFAAIAKGGIMLILNLVLALAASLSPIPKADAPTKALPNEMPVALSLTNDGVSLNSGPNGQVVLASAPQGGPGCPGLRDQCFSICEQEWIYNVWICTGECNGNYDCMTHCENWADNTKAECESFNGCHAMCTA
jgi:hypothetical protein